MEKMSISFDGRDSIKGKIHGSLKKILKMHMKSSRNIFKTSKSSQWSSNQGER